MQSHSINLILQIRDEHSLWPTVDYHQLELECSVHQKVNDQYTLSERLAFFLN